MGRSRKQNNMKRIIRESEGGSWRKPAKKPPGGEHVLGPLTLISAIATLCFLFWYYVIALL